MLNVTIRERDGDEGRQQFDKEEVTIGRAKGCDILLPKNNISKRHARLVDKDDKVVLVDLRSTNGTYVNGRRITAPEIIGPDDKIYIGDFVLQVEAEAAEAAPAPAPPEEEEEFEATAALDAEMMAQVDRGGPTEAVGGQAAAQAEQEAAEAAPEPVASQAAPEMEPGEAGESEVGEGAWDEVLESTAALDLGEVEAAAEAPVPAEPEAAEAPEEAWAETEDWEVEAEAAPEAQPAPEPEPEPEPRPSPEAEVAFEAPEPVAPREAPELKSQPEVAPAPEAAPAQPAAAAPTGEPLDFDGLNALLGDASVEQILINGWDRVAIVRAGGTAFHPAGFGSREGLDATVQELVRTLGYEGGSTPPVIDSVLPSGASVHIVGRPLAPEGPVVTIRRPRTQVVTLEQLVERGVVTREATSYLSNTIAERKNVVVAGLPGSGRTTVLNALACLVPSDERVVVLEDAREIGLPQDNVLHLDKSALEDHAEDYVALVPQLLAERVVIDPVSGADVYPFVAMALGGYRGSLATATSDSAHGLLRRMSLELELFAGARFDDRARAMVSEAVDVVVLVKRTDEGTRVVEIVEVEGVGDQGFETMELL
ncbi:MAG: ATPase, T2SS/T4P/T4SS family [Myxococcota bacterium]